MRKMFAFKAKVWKYGGVGGWYFVYVPEKESKTFKTLPRAKKASFGSIKVRVKIGKTSWDTSLFPSKESPYLLAIKAAVRKKEVIEDGDAIKVMLTIL